MNENNMNNMNENTGGPIPHCTKALFKISSRYEKEFANLEEIVM